MKIKIVNEKNNPVLKRKELEVEIDFGTGATPGKKAVAEMVAKDKAADAGNIEVCRIDSDVGKASGKALVRIWEEMPEHLKPKEEKKDIDSPEKIEEAANIKEETPAEKPKEEKAEAKEAPKEEAKTSEVPKEEKKE